MTRSTLALDKLNPIASAVFTVDVDLSRDERSTLVQHLSGHTLMEAEKILNKIDLPSAEPDRVINEIEEIIGIEAHDAVQASAKTGAKGF